MNELVAPSLSARHKGEDALQYLEERQSPFTPPNEGLTSQITI